MKVLDFILSPAVKNQIITGAVIGLLLGGPITLGIANFVEYRYDKNQEAIRIPAPKVKVYSGFFDQKTGEFNMRVRSE